MFYSLLKKVNNDDEQLHTTQEEMSKEYTEAMLKL
jgi:hypothetical protein